MPRTKTPTVEVNKKLKNAQNMLSVVRQERDTAKQNAEALYSILCAVKHILETEDKLTYEKYQEIMHGADPKPETGEEKVIGRNAEATGSKTGAGTDAGGAAAESQGDPQ